MKVKNVENNGVVKNTSESLHVLKSINFKSRQNKGFNARNKKRKFKVQKVFPIDNVVNHSTMMPYGQHQLPKELEESLIDITNGIKSQRMELCNDKETTKKSKSEKNGQPILEKSLISTKNSDQFLESINRWNLKYEEQNLLLRKEIGKVEQYIGKIKDANAQLDEDFKLITIFTQEIENKLVEAFSNLAIPGYPFGATSNNICQYMLTIYSLKNSTDSDLVVKVRGRIQSLDMTVKLRDFV